MGRIVFVVSFFTYSGYYVGLAILFALNLSSMSRFYSIPLRLGLTFLMLFLIKQSLSAAHLKKVSKIIMIFMLFWAFYFIKVLYSENVTTKGQLSIDWFEYIFYAIIYVIVPFLTFTLIDFKKQKKNILNGFIFSGFMLGVVSLFVYGKALVTGIERISNLTYETGEATLSPLALSYAGSLTMVLCIFKLLNSKIKSKVEKIYILVTILLAFAMFLLGSSRGSVVAICLSIIVFLAYSPVKNKVRMIFTSLLVLPGVIWLIEASGSGVISRFDNIEKGGASGRDRLWSAAYDHFLENPLIGGLIEISGIYPHNFILEVLMATGLLGAFLILPIIFYGFKKSFNLAKEDMFIFLIFIQGFTAHFFSGSIWGATLLFMPLGILLAYDSHKNRHIKGIIKT